MRAIVCLLLGISGALAGCRDEPTIVIKFDPAVDAAPAAAVAKAAPVANMDAGAGAAKTAECKSADDCVVEPAECCDCANGGKQHAIAKTQAAASKKARDAKCKDTMCTMMLSSDPTCGKRAGCAGGRCVMVDAKPATPPAR